MTYKIDTSDYLLKLDNDLIINLKELEYAKSLDLSKDVYIVKTTTCLHTITKKDFDKINIHINGLINVK